MRALGRRRDALLLDDGDEEFESEEVVAVHGPSGRDPVRHHTGMSQILSTIFPKLSAFSSMR
ncbi:hypothetical protein Maq22A_2p40825 (plasmid) [Methylobacterium aquaticum]|uniref:Uncharacterized protein n=1 Tax=Methylobacterium aquaticum TaxID=270351 RepID=A0A0C6FSB3_9HYPH|nr:hypothetical protein Maq22A_2p40825 [Methylobacterium aquaticum]